MSWTVLKRRTLVGIAVTAIPLLPFVAWLWPGFVVHYWRAGVIYSYFAAGCAFVAAGLYQTRKARYLTASLILAVFGALAGAVALTRPYSEACWAQLRALDRQLQPLLQVLHSAPTAGSTPGNGPLQKPFVRLLCSLTPNDHPNMGDLALAPEWPRETLGAIGARMEWEIVEPLPNISPRSAVLISSAWRNTGRTISVSNGSVPEVRQFVKVFVVRLPDTAIVWQSPLLVGEEAAKPAIGSPGVTFVSEFRGDNVPQSAIDEAVARIPWNAGDH